MNITVFSFRQAFAVMWKLLPDLNRNFSLESLKDCFKNRQKHQSQNFTIPQSGGVTATSRFPTFCWSDDRPLSVPLSPRRIWISDRPAQFDPRLCWSTYLSPPPKKSTKHWCQLKPDFFFGSLPAPTGKILAVATGVSTGPANLGRMTNRITTAHHHLMHNLRPAK